MHRFFLIIIEVEGDIHLFALHGNICIRGKLLDADRLHIANPDRCGNGDIAVCLCQAQIVVGIAGLHFELHGGIPDGNALGGGNDAAVDDHIHLDISGIGGVGNQRLQTDGFAHILFRQDGTHFVTIQRVIDAEIIILRRIDTAVANCVINVVSGQAVRHDNGTGRVGVAPVALMVILIVGGRNMPAKIQRSGVFLIGGEVAGGADHAFAVADFNDGNQFIDHFIVISIILEVAEGRAGMVELAQGVGIALERGIVVAQCRGIGSEFCLRSALEAVRVIGVHMSQSVGPGHFIAVQSNKVFRCILVCQLMTADPLGRHGAVLNRSRQVIVKGVGMVGNRKEVQIVYLV